MALHIIFFSFKTTSPYFLSVLILFCWGSRTTILLCSSSTTLGIFMSSLFGTKGKFPGFCQSSSLTHTTAAVGNMLEKTKMAGEHLSCWLLQLWASESWTTRPKKCISQHWSISSISCSVPLPPLLLSEALIPLIRILVMALEGSLHVNIIVY